MHLGTLVPEAPCCVFFVIRHRIYWRFDIDDMVFANTLIWYHTRTNAQDRQGPVDWHTHKYILTSTVHTKAVLYCTEWITCWNEKILYRGRQCFSFSKMDHHPNEWKNERITLMLLTFWLFLFCMFCFFLFFCFVLFFAYDSIESNLEGDQSIWFFSLPSISYLMLLFFLFFNWDSLHARIPLGRSYK